MYIVTPMGWHIDHTRHVFTIPPTDYWSLRKRPYGEIRISTLLEAQSLQQALAELVVLMAEQDAGRRIDIEGSRFVAEAER
jgi:hypothetical protein